MELTAKSVLVTGAAKRVGRAIALAFAREGSQVVLHSNSSKIEAEATAAEIRALGAKCLLIESDLVTTEATEAMISALDRDFPPIDVLVNNASVFSRTPLAELTADEWDQIMNINLRAPFLLSRSLGLEMAKRGSGKIINIADSSVHRPYKNYLAYLVSKAALTALTRTLALELAPAVQVNTVAPGTVLMPENAADGLRELIIRKAPLKRVGKPEDVARMVVHLAKNGDFCTGGFYAVDGGVGIGG